MFVFAMFLEITKSELLLLLCDVESFLHLIEIILVLVIKESLEPVAVLWVG